MVALKIIPDAYKFMFSKIIQDHKSEINQEYTAVHKSSDLARNRDIDNETNIEIGRYYKMAEFPNTFMKTTGNSQFTLKSLLPVN